MDEKEVVSSSLKLWQLFVGLAGTVLPLVYIGGKKVRSLEAENESLKKDLLAVKNDTCKRLNALEQAKYVTLPHLENLQKICQQGINQTFSDETHVIVMENQATVNEIKLDMRDIKSDIRSICSSIQELKK